MSNIYVGLSGFLDKIPNKNHVFGNPDELYFCKPNHTLYRINKERKPIPVTWKDNYGDSVILHLPNGHMYTLTQHQLIEFARPSV